MNEKIKKWRDAFKRVDADAQAKIKCPECDAGFLIAKEEVWPEGAKIDACLICENCGRYNVATKNRL